jgi:ferredoxin
VILPSATLYILEIVAYLRGKQMPTVDANECVGCGACADNCPQDAITIDGIAIIDAEKCVECGACIDECPMHAISE